MPMIWPKETVFHKVELEVEDRQCPLCGRRMHTCDHRHHRVHSFQGPLHLINRLVRCPDGACPCHHRTFSPEVECTITMPWWSMDWEVFAWIGHRRFVRHWSVSQLRAELSDTYDIRLSDDTLERAIRRYQTMLAAREQDPVRLAEDYREVEDLVLSIDGLQPEKGHETLYVVRELGAKRVWFAESLLSSSEAEVRRLLVQARTWAQSLERPVRLWVSDKQEAFVKGIRTVFPGTPHRYCDNHFLRDVAKPILEADSKAKVKMRQKVRGLRTIEREILEARQARSAAPDPKETVPTVAASSPLDPPGAEETGDRQTPVEETREPQTPVEETGDRQTPVEETREPQTPVEETGDRQTPVEETGDSKTPAEDVVLDYCAAVRGILNDSQGGPLEPPGLRMASALEHVRASIQRNVDQKKRAR